ncbi:MAG: ATP-binding cassette domain-containing protein [Verrucomicrobia bacterium]|nr:ATP-binding cassette domain-containing protein [Verrucomicrobiota bacterium]
MIEVQNLTKRYAGVTAVDGVSFTVNRGEICGFLGPNGAGKSTTMKILSGFMPATSGQATVAGHDVFTESEEVRTRIGYMPENNPLYPDMRVTEYLGYRAALKGVPRAKRKARIDEVLQLCGLSDVRRRIVGQLSKGYKQRVGLADSLVHDPDLLILDEPTIGLDPNQIRQVRQLIKDLGKRHTILISTHILPEVEMTCNRVIIINKGKIVASDTPENLTKMLEGGGTVRAEIRGERAAIERGLRGLPGVKDVQIEAGNDDFLRATIYAPPRSDVRVHVFEVAAANRWTLRELSRVRQTLEDVFAFITMKEAPVKEEEGK